MGGFSVLNNLSALIAHQQSSATQMSLQKTLFRLSSGSRMNSGGDDAAGLAIADGLKAQIRTLGQSVRNANDGIGLIQVGDSALAQVTNLLNRAATLLGQAASDTVADDGNSEQAIEDELGEIYSEINRIGSATKFNGTAVFADATVDIFVGDTTNATVAADAKISYNTSALTVSGLGLSTGVSGSGSSITVAISANAETMLNEVNTAIANVAKQRGALGASLNRLENSVGIMQAQIQNLQAAESQIRDADMAAEIANLAKYQILTQVGLAAMAQANAVPQGVLSLLG